MDPTVILRSNNPQDRMFALGQKRTSCSASIHLALLEKLRTSAPAQFAIDQTFSLKGGYGCERIRSVAMTELKAQKTADPLAALPSAKEIMEQIALKEAEKASAAMRESSAAEAEKKALIEKFSKASGVSDEERMARAAAIIKRAANNGLTEVEIGRFPNDLCTDHGRAINQREPGWEKTLTGLPKELYEFWEKHLKSRGYKVGFQIVDFPGGRPGDIGMTLRWN